MTRHRQTDYERDVREACRGRERTGPGRLALLQTLRYLAVVHDRMDEAHRCERELRRWGTGTAKGAPTA